MLSAGWASLRAVSPARASVFVDLALSPSGRLRFSASETAIDVEPARLARLTQAFERGSGDGLMQLGGAELEGDLPPALGWFREFGHLFFTALCALPDLDTPGAVSAAPPSPDFDDLARSASLRFPRDRSPTPQARNRTGCHRTLHLKRRRTQDRTPHHSPLLAHFRLDSTSHLEHDPR